MLPKAHWFWGVLAALESQAVWQPGGPSLPVSAGPSGERAADNAVGILLRKRGRAGASFTCDSLSGVGERYSSLGCHLGFPFVELLPGDSVAKDPSWDSLRDPRHLDGEFAPPFLFVIASYHVGSAVHFLK